MDEYKSNSHKSKEERDNAISSEKRIKKVVTGSAKTKKKSGVRKLTDVFVPEDIDSVKAHIFYDILVPAFKDLILDTVKTLLGANGKNNRTGTASKVSYRSYYDKENDRKEYSSRRSRSGYDYDDIIFESRGDAEAVLYAMNDIVDQFGVASIGDLYDLADMPVDNYTLNKYGWTDLRNASVSLVRDGYVIKFPKAMPLN